MARLRDSSVFSALSEHGLRFLGQPEPPRRVLLNGEA